MMRLLLAITLLVAASSSAVAAPTKLAVFAMELEDYSAAAALPGEATADQAKLDGVTQDARDLLAKSGRYGIVDITGADAAPVKSRDLHDCDGCDAAIALKLGAEQSFVGVVRRISRTEYLVRFQIRDAHSGAVVAEGNSGLRIGADYSWSRGMKRLLETRLFGSD